LQRLHKKITGIKSAQIAAVLHLTNPILNGTHMKLISLGLSPPEKRSNPLDNPSVSLTQPANWEWFSGGRSTDSGEVINDVTALKISTVFTCCRVLSESIASLPVRLLKITPQGRVQELDNPLYFLLAVAPNPDMTSFVYWETVAFHLSLTGNSYSQIERSKDGAPIALWPLNPRLTRAVRIPGKGLAYETQDGESGGAKRLINAADCLHVPLMSFDGIVGLSPIMQAARSLGMAAAAEKYGSRFFGNNATPQLALISKQKFKAEDKVKIRQDWETLQTGANQHRLAVLDQDLDLKILSVTPDEAQFLETRVHQRSDICAIFRVPVHMAGSEQKLSNSNVEQINLAFITDTLRGLLSRIEAELVKKLMPRDAGKNSTLTVQFDLSERQRGDTAAQVSLISAGRQWGVLSANDGRRILGLPAGTSSEDIGIHPHGSPSSSSREHPQSEHFDGHSSSIHLLRLHLLRSLG
jgi:HK97 family phage portal protein